MDVKSLQLAVDNFELLERYSLGGEASKIIECGY